METKTNGQSQESLASASGSTARAAQEELKSRMKRLALRPPPTIGKVRAQWKASAELQSSPNYEALGNPMR